MRIASVVVIAMIVCGCGGKSAVEPSPGPAPSTSPEGFTFAYDAGIPATRARRSRAVPVSRGHSSSRSLAKRFTIL